MRIELTQASHELFMEYAYDAPNWDGTPWASEGNVPLDASRRGNLSDIIKKGLVESHEYEPGAYFLTFTRIGKMYAKANGEDLSWID